MSSPIITDLRSAVAIAKILGDSYDALSAIEDGPTPETERIYRLWSVAMDLVETLSPRCSACWVGDFHGHVCEAYDPKVDREHRDHPAAFTWRDIK